eukprot:scaffold10103_cov59-Phaeocystis_antarctica.AAC.5
MCNCGYSCAWSSPRSELRAGASAAACSPLRKSSSAAAPPAKAPGLGLGLGLGLAEAPELTKHVGEAARHAACAASALVNPNPNQVRDERLVLGLVAARPRVALGAQHNAAAAAASALALPLSRPAPRQP